MEEKANKNLGQHWLKNEQALEAISELAEVKRSDHVLEIGPGLGHLTKYLTSQASHVIAVEYDPKLADKLQSRVDADNLSVVEDDILKFDLTQLPAGYKVVANIPYYLTSNLIRVLCESPNPPVMMVLLVQKEVAERIAASAGQMSLLSVSVQLYYEAELGLIVPAEMFEPAPKVDSQVIILRRHKRPLFDGLDNRKFFQVVKAGFAGRRKKLRSSLAAGLRLSKSQADELLQAAAIDGNRRAQELDLDDWYKIYETYDKHY